MLLTILNRASVFIKVATTENKLYWVRWVAGLRKIKAKSVELTKDAINL